MKRILLSLIVAASAIAASAQDIFDSADNHSYFGVRLGYELSCPGDVKGDGPEKFDVLKNSSGFSVGVIYNMPLWKNLYFEPGASIYYNTYGLDRELVEGILNNNGLQLQPGYKLKSSSARQWGVRLDAIVGYKFNVLPELSLSLFTGPEFQLGLKGKTHVGVSEVSANGPLYGKDGYLNRCDVKWRFGVGATYLDHYTIAISGAAGMADQVRGSELSMHSNLFDITLGYNF